jgi:hypothetical protein
VLQLSTAVLFGLAAVLAASRAWRGSGRAAGFAVWFAAGTAALAVDKATRLVDRAHEGLHRVGVPDPPLLNGIDDLFFVAGGVAACALLIRYRDVVRDSWSVAVGIAAVALFAAGSFAIDAFGPSAGVLPAIEEWLELGMAGALAVTAWRLPRRRIARGFPRPLAHASVGWRAWAKLRR